MTNFILERLPELWLRTGEHILPRGLSTVFAVVAGMPLGILASRRVWLRGPVLSVVGILQTIPSLAMPAILLALLHRIGEAPAICWSSILIYVHCDAFHAVHLMTISNPNSRRTNQGGTNDFNCWRAFSQNRGT